MPDNHLRLAGKVAIVTGASRGIGASIAHRLASDGARLLVNFAQNKSAAQSVVAQIKSAGGDAHAVQADVADIANAAPLVNAAVERFGRLDILVNNAAIARPATLDEVDEALFNRHINTNLKAAVFLSQAAARAFNRGGCIINISSIGTRAARPQFMIYNATKAAIEMLTVTMSRDLGPKGIRVNAVAPGQTDTGMLRQVMPADAINANIDRTSLGRLGLPDDIAPVVAFLASDDAGWITGETIHVSGGQRL